MDASAFSHTLPLSSFRVSDDFWLREMELVRTQVLPYQWDALNDRVPGAAPSYCMHNFRAAARLNARRRAEADAFVPQPIRPSHFTCWPEDPEHPQEDRFYGFVFQDTDFSKWIEAVGYSLTLHPDPELEKTADEAIDLVCEAQLENGYLDTYYILHDMRFAATNLRMNHELYCLGHLIEGAIAYYEATGKEKLLCAACRFADWADASFGTEEGKKRGYPGHEIAEMALFRLYEVTGEERYLRLGLFFINERGQSPNYFHLEDVRNCQEEGRPVPAEDDARFAYHQAHKPVREQDEAVGHAVRAMYLYSGMADAARMTQDDGLLQACERLFHSTAEDKMYITGGVGSTVQGEAFTQPFDLPNDAAYAETCASIGLMFFARRMLQLRPDSRYADVMERALFNTVLAGIALDGKSFFYVNPLEVVPENCHRDQRLSHVKPVRQKWFGCACCPPNIARLISSLPCYSLTAGDNALYMHLYISGTVSAPLGGGTLNLATRANLPWDGHVEIAVSDGKADGTLAFRLPGWAASHAWTCDGKAADVRNGYLYLTGTWQTGDTVVLDFPMDVRIYTASDLVREDTGKVALMRGPLVYCAEEHDNGDRLHLLSLSTDAEKVSVGQEQIFGHATNYLTLPGQRRVRQQKELYARWQPTVSEPCEVKLIPYYLWCNRGENEMRVWLREN